MVRSSQMRLAVFAAFPQELSRAIGRLRAKKESFGAPFSIAMAKVSSSVVIFVESGIGIGNAQEAFSYVLKEHSPDFILSAGFGGALFEGSSIGDLMWASQFFLIPGPGDRGSAPPSSQWQGFRAGPEAREVSSAISGRVPMSEGSVLTLTKWITKAEIMKVLPAGIPPGVCDMETHYLARLSAERGLPFFAVRSITDLAGEEIPRELFETTDKAGRYRLSRSLATILSNPHLMPDVVRLGINSHIASKKICLLVEALAEMR